MPLEPTMPRRRSRLRSALCLLCLTPLWNGCASGSKGTDLGCIVFQPITYSSRDTPETVEQVEVHNVRWIRLCEGK
jgi:hypothetical protein